MALRSLGNGVKTALQLLNYGVSYQKIENDFIEELREMSENLKTQKLKTLKEHLNEVGKWKNRAKLTMVKNSFSESKSVINKLKDF